MTFNIQNSNKGEISLRSARAGLKDDSQAGFTTLDTETEMTMSRLSDLREIGGLELFSRVERVEDSDGEKITRVQLEKVR